MRRAPRSRCFRDEPLDLIDAVQHAVCFAAVVAIAEESCHEKRTAGTAELSQTAVKWVLLPQV